MILSIHFILMYLWLHGVLVGAFIPSFHRKTPFPRVVEVAYKTDSRLVTGRALTKLCTTLSDDDDDDDDEDDYEIGDADEIEIGKFVVDDDGEEPLPPLPQFLNEDTPAPSRPTLSLDETQKRIEEQQKQIDILMKAMQKKGENTLMELMEPLPPTDPSTSVPPTSAVTPLRVMLFIDGTWLYYSIHERPEHLCPIIARYGRGWQDYYNFNWNELPRIICEALQEQERTSGWSGQSRPMEVSRATVFTSVKKNTHAQSNRIKMFDQMKAAGYDVYMMETVGSGEKCIDIQLAVEMLHYATVPNAYDVAILISGDKDFMPALIRTRQKARKVGLVSKRPDCNRALYQTPNLIDYDVIWIDDYLDRLFSPKEGNAMALKRYPLSRFTVMKVLFDYMDKSGLPMVSSRDLGRYLKRFPYGGSNLQTQVKRQFRGLHLFVRESEIFTIQKFDSRHDKTFWISLNNNAEEALMEEAKRTQFSEIEKEFFDSYSLNYLDHREQAYESSLQELSKMRPSARGQHINGDHSMPRPRLQQLQKEHTPSPSVQTKQNEHISSPSVQPKQDYTIYTVAQLKEICRDRGLHVSGVKAALIDRLLEDDTLLQPAQDNDTVESPLTPTEEYLVGLLKEYIHASGGKASSRDIGRYLSANASFSSRQQGGLGNETALSELKDNYGSLTKFLHSHSKIFHRTAGAIGPDTGGMVEFQVFVRA